MSKILLLTAFGAGYVLGSKAGRERYDQIVNTAQKVRRDPRVEDAVNKVSDVAEEQAPASRTRSPRRPGSWPTRPRTPPTPSPIRPTAAPEDKVGAADTVADKARTPDGRRRAAVGPGQGPGRRRHRPSDEGQGRRRHCAADKAGSAADAAKDAADDTELNPDSTIYQQHTGPQGDLP